MTDEFAYSSFLERLRRSHKEICLPMLATTSKLQAADIMKERSAAGVKVRILLATPALVAKLRGNTMAVTSSDAITGWRAHARHNANIEVRLTSRVAGMWLASCAIIDGTVLRVDIYDPSTQRSLQGTLIEVTGSDGRRPNIISICQAAFDDAWNCATPLGRFAGIVHRCRSNWQWIASVGFAIGAILAGNIVASGILGSAAASFLVNGIVDGWPRVGTAIRRAVRNE